MSRDNESPIDPMYEPESPEVSERLSEIERQLKKARPRPIELDLSALEEATRATPLKPPVGSPRHRRYRWATLAASWACGALVGAIVMFLVMQQGVSGVDSTTTITHGERDETPAVAGHQNVDTPEPADDQPTISKGRWSELDAAVLALASPGSESAYGRNGTGLRAGMCLPHLVQPAREIPVSVALDQDDAISSRSAEPSPYPAPAPEITREKLMRELLGDSPGFVL